MTIELNPQLYIETAQTRLDNAELALGTNNDELRKRAYDGVVMTMATAKMILMHHDFRADSIAKDEWEKIRKNSLTLKGRFDAQCCMVRKTEAEQAVAGTFVVGSTNKIVNITTTPKRPYHISREERAKIVDMWVKGVNKNQIAQQLNRNYASVTRRHRRGDDAVEDEAGDAAGRHSRQLV